MTKRMLSAWFLALGLTVALADDPPKPPAPPAPPAPAAPQLTVEQARHLNVLYFMLTNLNQTLGKAGKEALLDQANAALAAPVPIYIGNGEGVAEFRRIITKDGPRIIVATGRNFESLYFNDPVAVEARILRRLALLSPDRAMIGPPDSSPEKNPSAWDLMGYYLSIAPKDRSADTQETRDLIEAFLKDGRQPAGSRPIWTAALKNFSDSYEIDFPLAREFEKFREEFLAKLKYDNAHELYAFFKKQLDRAKTAVDAIATASRAALPETKSSGYAKLLEAGATVRTYLKSCEALEGEVMVKIRPFTKDFKDARADWINALYPTLEARNEVLEKAPFAAAFLSNAFPAPALTKLGEKTRAEFEAWLKIELEKKAAPAAPASTPKI